MKRLLTGIGAIAFAVVLTGITMAGEQTATQTREETKTQTKAQVQNREQLQLMEKAGGVDAKTIEAMQKQHYGDGEIVIAGALSKASNQSVSEIMSLKKQGMGWGEIAQKYNLKLGDVMKSVHANINAYENHAKQTKNGNALNAANKIKNEIQNQEKMNMQEMMQNRNQQMQHEMNMNQQKGQDMRMNEKQPDMNMHK
jgi:hypothetical protein